MAAEPFCVVVTHVTMYESAGGLPAGWYACQLSPTLRGRYVVFVGENPGFDGRIFIPMISFHRCFPTWHALMLTLLTIGAVLAMVTVIESTVVAP